MEQACQAFRRVFREAGLGLFGFVFDSLAENPNRSEKMTNGKSEMQKFGERWKTSIKKGKSVLSVLVIFFPIIWMLCLKQQKILPSGQSNPLGTRCLSRGSCSYCREKEFYWKLGTFGQENCLIASPRNRSK